MLKLAQQMPPQPLAAASVFSLGSAIAGIALVSGVVNLLALTSPLFMLQVYDRVLSSRSVSTLVGLAVLAGGLLAFQALLDGLRSRTLLRIGERFDHQWSGRVHEAVILTPLQTRTAGDGMQPLRDLDNIRGFLSGNGPSAFFDLPWMPFYLGICFLFHFWIGMTALVGAVILVSLTILTNFLSRRPVRETIGHGMARNKLMEATRRNAEVVQALGLAERLAGRWHRTNADYLAANRRAGDIAGGFGGVSKALRIMLQSAILGVGAFLVIRQEVTPGIMIAASIMMGRALAPVDLAIGTWKNFLMARQSRERLTELLGQLPAKPAVLSLPAPQKEISVEAVSIVPPGDTRATVSGVNLRLCAGSALGIVGPSGSGKTTLARAMVGAWRPHSGKIRIDGATFDQWDREQLGRHIGYLPQGVELFEGTIAQNIARFDPGAESEAVIAAAKAAGAHELILRFENGYETHIGEDGSSISAGQRQRIGLARALYADPFLVVLDEPNANLDAEGEQAVVRAVEGVRARNGIAVVIAHRPGAIAAVDMVLVIENGRQKAFGAREEILSKVLKSRRSGNGTGHDADAAYRPTGRALPTLSAAVDQAGPAPPEAPEEDGDVRH